MRSSNVGMDGTGSERPVPRLSNRISRANDASREKKRACSGSSHWYSRWEANPGAKIRSRGPSPTTWYATWTSPLLAYRVSGPAELATSGSAC